MRCPYPPSKFYSVKTIFIVLAAISWVLSGCSSSMMNEADPPDGPKYVSNKLPQSFKTPAEAELPNPNEKWWEDFGSSELNSLVEASLTNNFDLRMAIARVAQTRAQAGVVKSAEYPTLDANLRYGNQAPIPGPGYATDTSSWSSQPLWQVGGLVGYEVDLWGKKGFDTESAYSQALASEFGRQAVALSLVGDVASTYFLLISLSERIKVSEKNLEEIKVVSRGLEKRVNLGDSTLIDLSQQLILQKNTASQVIALRLQKEKTHNRLATLLGMSPTSLNISTTSAEGVAVPIVGAGLPSDLLCRRPDIRKAEAELEGARADLYSARANLFPNFAITGAGGYGSFLLSQLAMPQSLFYNITAGLVQNIFDAGKRRSQIQVASAKNIELLESYANTVVGAMRDVEDGLSGVALTAKQYKELDEARNLARRLTTMSEKVVERGGMDYLQLYEIQKIVLNSEDAAISAKSDQLIASVNLYKAIGGSTQAKGVLCEGGGLPQANAEWVERANRSDSVFKSRPDLVVLPSGQPSYANSGMPLPGVGLSALTSPVDLGQSSDSAETMTENSK